MLGQPVEAPLYKILREAEAHVLRLGQVLDRRAIGRPSFEELAAHRREGEAVLKLAPSQAQLRRTRTPRQGA